MSLYRVERVIKVYDTIEAIECENGSTALAIAMRTFADDIMYADEGTDVQYTAILIGE